jgi:hypothetical protein
MTAGPASPTPHPRLSVNSIRTRGWPLERDLRFWQSHGYPQVGLVSYKLDDDAQAERGLAAMVGEHLDQVALVQVSDFVVGTEVRLSRSVPGDGDIPLSRIIGDLLQAGYPGAFDLEILGPRIEEEGYDSAVPRGAKWLSDCLTALGA